MLKIFVGAMGVTIAGAAAWAGGLSDAIVETVPDEVMPVAAEGSANGWIIPVVIVGLLLAAAAAGGGDDDDPDEADEENTDLDG